MQIAVELLSPRAKEPTYAHPGGVAADLYACDRVVIPSSGHKVARTGVRIGIPDGFVGLVHPCAALAMRKKVTILGAPGTVDSGVSDEVQVVLVNHGWDPAVIEPGDRIAQLVIQRVERPDYVLVVELADAVEAAG